MEFRNLTPFSVMNYKMLDVDDIEHHVIVMKVGYDLIPTDNQRDYIANLVTDLTLEFEDQFVNKPNASSVRLESDLAPFKPCCDVLVNGTAYAPNNTPAESIVASVSLIRADNTVLLEKSLRCLGPRQFVLNENSGEWQLTPSKPLRQLPIDYRYAFGGECKIYEGDKIVKPIADDALFPAALRAEHPEKDFAPIAHSTHEYNPLGQGFITPWYQQSKGITTLPAPQIESLEHPITAEWVTTQLNNAAGPHQVVGFGAIGRTWQPRRLLAGTYDEIWLNQRHPYLPSDFDFGYWNCAPTDQQIAYPTADFSLTLTNLTPNSTVNTTLPGHRPFVLLRMLDGQLIPLNLNLDTLLIDTEKLQLALTYRLMIKADLPIRVTEARFEMDTQAPLVRFSDPKKEVHHG
ncbi:DUF2169 family type VI secretion system accessory protein [Providencia rettgeri]|uniref:DUF2169 family type VI secretion system accessory protein n=1 Tax=Providencia rettgeri TaxID=587 RepID=UPI0023AB4F79|nr:DUF2169 domain-containing protein [Providencia rettgeri]